MQASPVEMCGKMTWLCWNTATGTSDDWEEKITKPVNKHRQDPKVNVSFSLFSPTPLLQAIKLSNSLFPRTKLEISQSINRWPLWSPLHSYYGSR